MWLFRNANVNITTLQNITTTDLCYCKLFVFASLKSQLTDPVSRDFNEANTNNLQ